MEAAQRQPRRVLHTRRKDPKPCRLGSHVGPLIDCEKFDTHEDERWHGVGNCAVCGSTIHKSQLRARAA